MSLSLGKQFEEKFKKDWIRTIPNSSIDRLYDSVSGYKTISNISDFIGYKKPNIFYLECKSHAGNTFPWTCLSQYDKLIKKIGIEGVRAGVILWMYDHDVVVYLPISTIRKMKYNGLKSFNIKLLNDNPDNYKIIVIPSVKKRTFMDSDYSVLLTLTDYD